VFGLWRVYCTAFVVVNTNFLQALHQHSHRMAYTVVTVSKEEKNHFLQEKASDAV